ncbi:MAG: MFS transporter, partial [Planctomycetaceae bacterium]|nr:MFS transporter [Planctomycetaceae bacterium]
MRRNLLSLPRNVWLLSLASLLNDVASEMIYPLLPVFLTVTLGGSKSFLGLIEGVADSTASLLKLWSGHWSDRLGRRRGLIVTGYLLTVVSRPLVGLATAPWHVLVTRFADRVGKGVRTAPRDAMIADSTPVEKHGQAFGFHRAMDHAGAVIGPALGAWFLYCWPAATRTLFLLTIVPGMLVVALLYFGLRDLPRDTPEMSKVVAPPRSFGPAFHRYLIATGVFTLGGASDAFLLLRASELGIEIKQIPLLWIGYHVVKSVGNFLGGGLVDRVGARRLLVGGWLLHGLVLI